MSVSKSTANGSFVSRWTLFSLLSWTSCYRYRPMSSICLQQKKEFNIRRIVYPPRLRHQSTNAGELQFFLLYSNKDCVNETGKLNYAKHTAYSRTNYRWSFLCALHGYWPWPIQYRDPNDIQFCIELYISVCQLAAMHGLRWWPWTLSHNSTNSNERFGSLRAKNNSCIWAR